MRVGIGYDAHRFEQGRKLILGGVHIPFETGLAGHSDADVLIHAIIDALLGAASMGDIGSVFPDTQDEYKNISSTILLNRVWQMLSRKGYVIKNIDSVIIAQKPRLAPYIEDMRLAIADILELDNDAVSVKATTTEGLGFEGRKEGISAQAICLLERND
ncbi:MAG: 2-C-methyl-D-erythritol 2,4-cyclodiphosphate synthase [Eubacteriales bacterium]|nr:2-C-methyl-D-erythritol 2,4-cyclodiphosphate synthase [Eubacteriales bacterium]